MITALGIFGAVNPRRDTVNWEGTVDGWVPRFNIRVSVHRPESNDPNAREMVNVFVGQALNPPRILVRDQAVSGNGWRSMTNFWAWRNPGPNRAMVSVATTPNPWRSRFELNRRIGDDPVTDAGWSAGLIFYVPRATVRVFR